MRELLSRCAPLLAAIVGLIAVGGCEPDWGACVEHYGPTTDGLSWDICREDHMDGECTGSDEFHPGLSCADVGYPYFCTSAELEQNGLGADDSYVEDPGCDPLGGGGPSDCDADTVWVCAYDGQATPMCQSACNYPPGDSRDQQCAVLDSILEPEASECCTVCQ